MDNIFFWGGLVVLAVMFAVAAIIRKKNSGRKRADPSDIYPMW